jgi:signal peptidase
VIFRRDIKAAGSVAVKAAGYVAAAVAVGLLALNLVVPRLTGTVPLTVLTGSMSPTIPTGSLVLVRPTSVSKLKIGDVITFETAPGTGHYITHRIVEIHQDGNDRSFTTKGDANPGEDIAPVSAKAVRGRVVFHAPNVGALGNRLRSPGGMTAIFVLFSGALLASTLRERWTRCRPPVRPAGAELVSTVVGGERDE